MIVIYRFFQTCQKSNFLIEIFFISVVVKNHNFEKVKNHNFKKVKNQSFLTHLFIPFPSCRLWRPWAITNVELGSPNPPWGFWWITTHSRQLWIFIAVRMWHSLLWALCSFSPWEQYPLISPSTLTYTHKKKQKIDLLFCMTFIICFKKNKKFIFAVKLDFLGVYLEDRNSGNNNTRVLHMNNLFEFESFKSLPDYEFFVIGANFFF